MIQRKSKEEAIEKVNCEMRITDVRFSGCRNSGGDSERDPPVPIPNTEVKPFSADGTWLETARESRTLPDPK